MPTTMTQYVIYKTPLDAPGRFVVRRWTIGGAPPYPVTPEPRPVANVATLEEARAAVQRQNPNLVCLDRDPNDDPAIAEVWL